MKKRNVTINSTFITLKETITDYLKINANKCQFATINEKGDEWYAVITHVLILLL